MGEETALRVPYALSVYGNEEIEAAANVFREHKSHLTEKTREFENKVAALFNKKYGVMVNSGSSANLLAVELMNLKERSKVITPVLTFSTTLAPLLQKRLEPVFVDVDINTYLVKIDQIEKNISPDVKALMIPSLLGNIPDMERLSELSKKNGLYFVEDSCDTLGAKFNGVPTGTFSDFSTTSFYGSHIITAGGGGGMLCVNTEPFDRRARILRGWGRSSAVDETEDVNKRFGAKVEGIQYDSKFIFEEVGYNFMALESSAAFGLEQLKRLNTFIKIRQNNFSSLKEFFSNYIDFFNLPEQLPKAETAWLAFPLTLKEDIPFKRLDFVKYLEENNIQTRPVFTGNVLRQPAFKGIEATRFKEDFPNADYIMKNGLLIGCNQGLEKRHIDKIKKVAANFLDKF